MSQPILKRVSFASLPLYLLDESGRQLLAEVIQTTSVIESRGQLTLAEKQTPINPAGEHYGKPEESSYKYEPEFAFMKPATDVVLIGSAYPRWPGDTEVNVSLHVGPVH